MKRILLISPNYPLPENIGTNMRTMHFVRFFKNIGIVDIAYSNIPSEHEPSIKYFDEEFCLQLENNPEKLRNKILRWIYIKNRPFPILKYTNESEKILLSIIESNKYDYIFVRYIYNTGSLFKLLDKYKKRTIIDFDDILSGSLYEAKIASANGQLRKLRLKVNKKYLTDYERRCLSFGASIFCSEKDKEKLINQFNEKNAFVVPNIYTNNSFEGYDFGDGFQNGNILLFVGTLGYEPNAEGLRWFIKNIYPDFRRKYPDSRLIVVGHSSKDECIKLCRDEEGVELHKNALDVKEYYRKCKAVIVPILVGGGTRIKILEAAMAYRPVISTQIGAEGLELREGKDILLFKDACDFLIQYEKLLEESKYRSLVRNSWHITMNKYSANEFNRAMKNVLDVIDGRTDLSQFEISNLIEY